jgi:hypothetical protein
MELYRQAKIRHVTSLKDLKPSYVGTVLQTWSGPCRRLDGHICVKCNLEGHLQIVSEKVGFFAVFDGWTDKSCFGCPAALGAAAGQVF